MKTQFITPKDNDSRFKKEHPQSVEPDKGANQDELWLELGKLWGAYPTKDNNRWLRIKSKFTLTRK